MIASMIALALLPLMSSSAAADEYAAELVAFHRSSPNLLSGKGVVSISFRARDEGPAGLARARFIYETPIGNWLYLDSPWMDRAASADSVATGTLSAWAASGTYRLIEAQVADAEGNSTTYLRDSSAFDMASADFEVDNPVQDVTAPILTDIDFFQEDVQQGTPVVALYTASDDLSGVAEVTLSGTSPGGDYAIRSLPGLGAVGPAVWVSPFTAASGRYEITHVSVTDHAGNMTLYQRERAPETRPERATPGPEHAPVDVSALGFNIVGGKGDPDNPLLTSFEPLTPYDRRLNETVAVDFTADDFGGSGIWQVWFFWEDDQGREFRLMDWCGDTTRGPVSNRVEDYRTIGNEWRLDMVVVIDNRLNHTHYFRDGGVSTNGDTVPEFTHTFDFPRADFQVVDGPQRAESYPEPQWCPPLVADVNLAVDDPTVKVGDPVEIVGEVTGPLGEVPHPVTAIHEWVQGEPRLLGVTQGDGDGSFLTDLIAQRNTSLEATFLGASGPAGADGATSERVRVRVSPHIHAELSRTSVRSGGVVSLSGRLTPATDDPTIVLQKRVDGRWSRLSSASADARGAFAFPIKGRVGTHRFRVVRPAGDGLSKGTSRTLRLEVRP